MDDTKDFEIEEWKPQLSNLHENSDNRNTKELDNEKFNPENTVLEVISDINKQYQKCHICEKFFENLEMHFAASHIKEEIGETSKVQTIYTENFEDTPDSKMCRFCRKFFNRKRDLKRHIKTVHEGIKDHHCSFCEKSFSRADRLNSHVKLVHEGMKDHVCSHCKNWFTTAQSLKIHVKAVHEGIKEHLCNSCGKGFSDARDLKRHVKAVHEGVEGKRERAFGHFTVKRKPIKSE